MTHPIYKVTSFSIAGLYRPRVDLPTGLPA